MSVKGFEGRERERKRERERERMTERDTEKQRWKKKERGGGEEYLHDAVWCGSQDFRVR